MDYFKDREIPVGPGPAMRLSPETVAGELSQAGFKVEVDQTMLPYQYVVTATLP
ncbi:MAG: hypothetical protein HY319_32430 [Armatimonadetes bacterium]|nr:hypothetical protein [Armatimonadota bacterium]